MRKPTCREIAASWKLWQEYIDPGATMSYEEWDALSGEEALNIIHDTFPGECNCADDDD